LQDVRIRRDTTPSAAVRNYYLASFINTPIFTQSPIMQL